MEITIAGQTWSFLLSIALGAALGSCYDVFRILRIAVRHPAAAVAAEDLAFSLICAAASFFYMVYASCGQIRLFVLVGEAVGFTLYYCTVGTLVIGVSKWIISAFRWLGRMLDRLLIAPVFAAGRKIERIYSQIVGNTAARMKNRMKNSKTYLKKRGQLLYNLKKWHLGKRQAENAKKQESLNR